jgi:tRNA A37 methylthiotransferase MiaB
MVQSEISLRHKQALVGKAVDVLVEGYSKTARKELALDHAAAGSPCHVSDGGPSGAPPDQVRRTRQLVGRTPSDLITVFDGDDSHIGAIVKVRVQSASALTLFGQIESVVSPPRRAFAAGVMPLPLHEAD